MKYSKPLQRVKLIRRYKRFLADVEWPDGRQMTVHTANTGSMLGCSTPGNSIWIRDSENHKRKYRYSWEISETDNNSLIGVNTILANKLVVEGIERGVINELSDYNTIKTEVPYGERSRIDILLQDGQKSRPDCYVEVKNVTAREGDYAIFPDAVTARGTKHLQELVNMVQAGYRSVIFFCIQRNDVSLFRAAHEIDPVYAKTLAYAVEQGVEALAYSVTISPDEIALSSKIAVKIT
jgi:sugar fermentation stimulation protein A